MFGKIASALSSAMTPSAPKPGNTHNDPARAATYSAIASEIAAEHGSVSNDDCAKCDGCDDAIWDGKTYPDYVMERYGDLGELPPGFDVDWDTDLAGSAAGGRGKVVVISTGKSDWERDHVDEKDSLAHHLDKHIQSLKLPAPPAGAVKDLSKRPPASEYILKPDQDHLPSLYSSSLISQSDDPEDQTVLVFPDWTVVQEVENSAEGAAGLYAAALGQGVKTGGTRQRSWVLPYRAIILLCSHKRRDKRCHIAAPLLRSALHTVLAKHDIGIDETGASLAQLDGPAIEDMGEDEREMETRRRMAGIEGIGGGEGGEVGIFNINHVGGHRYAGVMLRIFPMAG
ncbi:Sucrase/ferredoxin-like-domain-containing protein [Dioszegia hungarica]|uniref:Sucrase/ferredoxin-like-domain-containing protein n=1 Tax=Dioszegia hungarica TaxID=4972 RepID=A0AA38LY29_9TREE|nr:Sucrase/ferredoxin-like-domain-containing protein [Dioszegia hungarica]KAI9638221.1 Sucrase/ferredoxin-like-domain-containing protein [Dioszegia hungarica]